MRSAPSSVTTNVAVIAPSAASSACAEIQRRSASREPIGVPAGFLVATLATFFRHCHQ
jgi:hypothetical protein